jgi:hypothetical protein
MNYWSLILKIIPVVLNIIFSLIIGSFMFGVMYIAPYLVSGETKIWLIVILYFVLSSLIVCVSCLLPIKTFKSTIIFILYILGNLLLHNIIAIGTGIIVLNMIIY